MPRKKNKRKAIQRAKRAIENREIRFPKAPPVTTDLARYQTDLGMAVAMAFAVPTLTRKAIKKGE